MMSGVDDYHISAYQLWRQRAEVEARYSSKASTRITSVNKISTPNSRDSHHKV
jgi:hypothetical protein